MLSRPVAASIISLGWVQDGIDDVEAGALRWMNNIGSAEVVSAVVSLGWVQDGIDAVEVKTIEELSYIAYRDADFASYIVSLGWVQDGIDAVEVKAIENLSSIASRDAEIASSIVSLGWVQDGIDAVEVEAIQSLLYIAVLSRPVAASIISLGWVQDGIDDVEAGALRWMNNIGSAEVVSAVVSLGWVQDGIDAVEVKTIEELSYIAYRDSKVAEVALSVFSLGWVQDGIDAVEVKAIENLFYVAYRDADFASYIVSLGWVQDGIDAVEVKAIENLSSIASRDAEIASSIVSLGWVQDGIDAVEVEAIENLSYIVIRDAGVASSIVSLGWVQEDIDTVEVKAIENLSSIANSDAGVASSVVSLSWVQDGIDTVEVKAIENLSHIAIRDAAAALRIVGMPFVDTIEPPDISAIESLGQLAASTPETLVRVISHAALRDGISDDLAQVVATLHGVAGTNPGLIDVLLDPSKVIMERRAITLPLAGDVVLAIIRTAPGAARSMDLLEHSVRSAEELMGAPLPTRYVGLLYENAVPGSAAGANFGTHIAIRPEFDVDDGSHYAVSAGHSNAHEVAHYYWSGNEDWVDEGAADFMASVIEGVRTGSPIGVTNPPCDHAGSIADLESLGIAQADVEFRCNYSLGERLFVDLHRTLGEERFQQGFRSLYLASEAEDDADNLRGTSVGIEHVREAFHSDDGAETPVIARWYDGSEPYDLSRLDTTPVDSSLSSINGRIDEAYVSMKTDGPGVSAFSSQDVAGWVYFTLKYSYGVSGGQREVPLEIVEYYEDGFEFNRRSGDLTAQPGFAGGTSWFSVGSPPSHKWAPGRYWVYVYAGDRKVAEVQYEVTP